MFFLEEENLQEIFDNSGGKVQSTFGQRFELRNEAIKVGQQSFSEMDQLMLRVDKQAQAIERDTGTPLVDVRKSIFALVNDDRITPRATERFKQSREAINAAFRSANLPTIDELREQVALAAREADDKANEADSRADGAITSNLAAGALQSFREPANHAAMLATAPIGLSTFTGSLLTRLGAIAAIEGTANGASEAVIQNDLRDFYSRQGFTEEEIDERVNEAIIMAAAGGAILAPALLGGGLLIKAGLQKLKSPDPKIVREGLDELKNSGALSKAETAQAELVSNELDVARNLPPNVEATPANLRKFSDDSAVILDSIESGKVTPAARKILDDAISPEVETVIGLDRDTVQRLLDEETLSSRQKLVKAFGSEEKADRFEELDLLRNSTNPETADKAAKQFDDEFDETTFTPEQNELVFGVGEKGFNQDELQTLLRAFDSTDFADEPSEVVADVLVNGIRNIDAQKINDIRAGKGTATQQEAFIKIGNAMTELRSRGLGNDELEELTLDAAERVGFSREDAGDIISDITNVGRRTTEEPDIDTPSIAEPASKITERLANTNEDQIDELIEAQAREFLEEIDKLDEIPDELKLEFKKSLDDIAEDETALEQLELCLRG